MLKTAADLQKEESARLAPYAVHSKDSLGRVHNERGFKKSANIADPRLPFQRDRDRIIHCRSFRRLKAKTQVFTASYGDHYHDRLTHSIEVAQIARDIARRLGLNEDLAECIALAHDLGHPPFGHGGQDALNEMMEQYGLHFEHNEQSRRIVEKLERIYPTFNGLNLTKEVLDGLIKHNPERYDHYVPFETYAHLEAQVTDMADEIAYINHDVADALRSGIITLEDLEQLQLWRVAKAQVYEEYGEQPFDETHNSKRRLLSRIISHMISRMIQDLQESTSKNLAKNTIDSVQKVRDYKGKLVHFSEELQPHVRELRKFLFERFYLSPQVQEQIQQGQTIIKKLFQYYMSNPEKLHPTYQNAITNGEKAEIVVKDYIAGMTDHYARQTYKKLI